MSEDIPPPPQEPEEATPPIIQKSRNRLLKVVLISIGSIIAAGAVGLPIYYYNQHQVVEQAKEKLKAHGIFDINGTDDEGRTPLFMAAAKGNEEVVKLLIDAGADVNIQDKYGNTALINAAFRKKGTEIVRMLIEAGADVNIHSMQGRTALHAAAYHEHADMAVVGAINEQGEFISLTAKVDKRDIEVINMLIEAGADVNIADDVGTTPLHLASDRACTEIISLLINAGADINKQTRDGFTPLHIATDSGLTENVKLFIEAGAEVNKQTEAGVTPLMQASCRNNTEIVKLLIASGANVNKENAEGRTAMHYAAYFWKSKAIQLLIEAGADVNKRDNNGATPLRHARASGSRSLGQNRGLFASDPSDPIYRHMYAEYRNETINLLISAGAH